MPRTARNAWQHGRSPYEDISPNKVRRCSMEEIMELLNSFGFPIACTFLLGYLLYREQITHKEETASLKEAINSNTIVMTELKQLITDLFRGDKDVYFKD